jgi:hypothetical protein
MVGPDMRQGGTNIVLTLGTSQLTQSIQLTSPSVISRSRTVHSDIMVGEDQHEYGRTQNIHKHRQIVVGEHCEAKIGKVDCQRVDSVLGRQRYASDWQRYDCSMLCLVLRTRSLYLAARIMIYGLSSRLGDFSVSIELLL